ncbi:unnamed protein product [Calypogeia fissa]
MFSHENQQAQLQRNEGDGGAMEFCWEKMHGMLGGVFKRNGKEMENSGGYGVSSGNGRRCENEGPILKIKGEWAMADRKGKGWNEKLEGNGGYILGD